MVGCCLVGFWFLLGFFEREDFFVLFFILGCPAFGLTPCSLSSPMLKSQEVNRKNWKKRQRSEVPLLVHTSREGC